MKSFSQSSFSEFGFLNFGLLKISKSYETVGYLGELRQQSNSNMNTAYGVGVETLLTGAQFCVYKMS